MDKKKPVRVGPPPMVDGWFYVNPGLEDQMQTVGYRQHMVKTVVSWIFIVLTVGLLRLVFHWKPDWFLRCTHSVCPLKEAEFILMQDQYKQWFVEKIKHVYMDGTAIPSKEITDKTVMAHVEDFKDTRKIDSSGAYFSSGDDSQISHPLLNTQLSKERLVLKYFVNKKIKYVWNPSKEYFERLRGLEVDLSCSFFHQATGLSDAGQSQMRILYDFNAIVVHVTPILILVFTQILNPFYVFQVFSVILWYNDEYYYYATCIIVISVISLTVEIYDTRSMQKALKSTVNASTIVTVCKDSGEFVEMSSDALVPGDVIEVPRNGCIMQCDAVLITGNCIVNESMLTGESVPVTKTPIPNPKLIGHDIKFNVKEHGRHVLFCGTDVIQTRYYGNQKVKAVVLRTGFATAKGELVRSIMFPKPVDFKFTQDSYKFIGVLAGISAFGMVYTLVLMIMRGDYPGKIVLRTLDLITIVVPPALPAAMTIGIVFAQKRLRRSNIFCISPKSINVCGAISCVCFDKTGTLTEDGLDMLGVTEVTEDGQFKEGLTSELDKSDERSHLTKCMASCHSLTIIDGNISGDPLDLKMFEATSWDLEEPGEDTSKYDMFMPTLVRPKKPDIIQSTVSMEDTEAIPYEVGILRQFTFSSKLQRMSVITRTLGENHFDLYAKGSPEMIASLSKPETLPSDFHDVLMCYTQQGHRVIALAYKPLRKLSYVKIQRAQREQMECDLHFLGLMIMENRLKQETTPIICELANANIRTIMITGDNMLTALSVARDCEMISKTENVILVTVVPPSGGSSADIYWNYAEDATRDVKEVHTSPSGTIEISVDTNAKFHFAMTGKSWALMRKYFSALIPKLVVRGTVFARMSPDQKQQLVEELQDVGYYVGMCGDGANDCGALKTAHAGISLSEAEASVASPFTSKEPNIGCIPTVIKEGRAALVTSFGIFKYMASYSLTQFTSVCILYWIGANLTDFTFLYIDLFLLTSLSITFSYTRPYSELVPEVPSYSLLSVTPILSIIVQMIVNIFVQFFVWVYTQEQPWFEEFVPNDDDDYEAHEVTAVFCVSSFQYITLAICFSKGAPYRKNMFTNWIFLLNIVLCVLFSAYVTIYPFEWLRSLLELYLPTSIAFRALLVGIAAINFLVCYLLESYVVDSNVIRKCEKAITKRKQREMFQYVTIEEDLEAEVNWPPVSKSFTSLADLMRIENLSPVDSPVEGESTVKERLPKLNMEYENGDAARPMSGKSSGSGYQPVNTQSPPPSPQKQAPSPPISPLVNATGDSSVLVLNEMPPALGKENIETTEV